MKCHSCRYWIKSVTLGSPDTEVWHCRCGFTPDTTCQYEAGRNEAITQGNKPLVEYYTKRWFGIKTDNQLKMIMQ